MFCHVSYMRLLIQSKTTRYVHSMDSKHAAVLRLSAVAPFLVVERRIKDHSFALDRHKPEHVCMSVCLWGLPQELARDLAPAHDGGFHAHCL